jgi:RecA-family ATPase
MSKTPAGTGDKRKDYPMLHNPSHDKPQDALTVFKTRCEARACLVDCGELDFQEAVDGLQSAAEAYGLVFAIGQDAVQQIMAEAFAFERPKIRAGFVFDRIKTYAPVVVIAPVVVVVSGFDRAGFDELCRKADAARESQENGGGATLNFIDISKWDETPAPPREWAVPDRIPLKQPTLLSGEGAAGKSLLLLQLAVATVLGRIWLDAETTMGPAIYFGCEDDADELHRRLDAINKYYNVAFHHLVFRGFKLLSFAGKDAVLGATNRSGRVEATNLFHQLYCEACEIRPRVLVLDTASDIFAGKENDRSEVRQFLGLLRKLAIDASAAVVIASHPSLSGIASGTGTSGSTQWHNSVRARMYLKAAREGNGDENEADNGLRELVFMKNQYGPLGHRVLLRWQSGLFLPVASDAMTIEQALANDAVDDLFLKLLRRFTAQGRNVSDKTGTSYAPAKFTEQAEAKGLDKKALAAAMDRLFAAGRIKVLTEGPPSHPRTRLVEVASTAPSTDVPPPSTGVCVPSPHTPLPGGSGQEGGGSPARSTGVPQDISAYEVVGSAPPGTRCIRCGKGRGVALIRQGAAVDPFHEQCWKERLEAAEAASSFFKLPDLGPDPLDEHGKPIA